MARRANNPEESKRLMKLYDAHAAAMWRAPIAFGTKGMQSHEFEEADEGR